MSPEGQHPETLPALLDQAVERFGDEPFIITPHETFSFREVRAQSRRLAKGLLAVGVGKGSRVGLLMGNSPLMMVSLFAGWQVGALMIPASTIAAPGELAHILRHCDAQILLANRSYVNRDYAGILASALPSLAQARDPRALRLPEAPYLRSIWLDEPGATPWARGVSDLIAEGERDASLDEVFLGKVQAEVSPADDAVVIYTSGSTTAPKAVVHGQGPMTRQGIGLAQVQGYRHGQRPMSLGPMFWVGGLNMIVESLAAGAHIVIPDGVSTRAYVDAVRDLGADRMIGWPAQTKAMRELMDAEGINYGHLGNFGVDRLPDGTPKAPDQTPNQLGMTETFGPHSAASLDTVLPEHRRGAFGPARGGFERRVVDPETGVILGHGQVGELWLRDGSLMKGMYKKERSEVFSPDGFYNTNDLVQIEPDDYMYFRGRTGDMLKTKGANVSRVEVEIALRGLPGVAEAVVCGLPDEVLGQRVVAAVVPEPGASVEEGVLKAQLKEKIAGYKVPSHILIIDRDELIWSATGKIRIPEMGRMIAERLGL